MILKGSQRAGATQLADHLLNANDNDHVTVHEISGFMADDVHGAFREAQGWSEGTQCKQYLFSLSLNPPPNVEVSTEQYEQTVSRIEQELNLDGQPRVIVFHEKEGRIHAHAVWSRIDAEAMKAIPMSFFKNKLMEISRDIYLENDWPLPAGFLDHEKRDATNYSLHEYQQAKRMDQNPKLVKAVLRTCWKRSENRESFETALKKQGFYLARGDRRGFVAVSMTGEPLSLSRWLGVKTKELKAKLGDPVNLPSMTETLESIHKTKSKHFDGFVQELEQRKQTRLEPLLGERREIIRQQKVEREKLCEIQEHRSLQEHAARQSQYRKGLRGLWDRVTGTHKKLRAKNKLAAEQSQCRDARDWDTLRQRQFKERHHIVSAIRSVRHDIQKEHRALSKIREKTSEISECNNWRGLYKKVRDLQNSR